MSRIQNVSRKGGTYYFRRVIRLGNDKPFRLRLSLRTMSHSRARIMAPAVTVACEALRMSMMQKIGSDGLSAAQRAEIFRRQMLQERDWLEAAHARLQMADLGEELTEEALHYRLDAEEALSRDRAINGGTGPAILVKIPPDDAPDDVPVELIAWSELENTLGAQEAGEAAVAQLAALGIGDTALNLQMARKIIHEARVEAIREYRNRLENPGAAYPAVPVHAFEVWPSPGLVAPAHIPAPALATAPANACVSVGVSDTIWSRMTATEAALRFIEANPRTGGTDGNARKQGPTWTEKTREQFKLPALLLEQVMEGRPLATVTEEDLVRINQCFNSLHGASFRKSEQQRKMTILEIVEETADLVRAGKLDEEKLGLGVSTTNRHWGFLRQLTTWFALHRPIAHLNYKAFIYDDERDPRDLQDTYSVEEGRALFSLPPWTGCQSLSRRMNPGEFILHDACYFVPLIAWHTGLRREEICGLELDDLAEEEGQWYFIIRANATRRLKTTTSRRLIPMAEELVRLGLPEYVAALRGEGETLLFPELRPQSGKGCLGDAFYKNWWTKLARHLPFLEQGQAVHAFRHTMTDELKAQEVFEEVRADLVGHRLQSETAGRYSKAARMVALRDAVEKVPVVTKHLDPAPIELLPRLKRAGRKARPQRT